MKEQKLIPESTILAISKMFIRNFVSGVANPFFIIFARLIRKYRLKVDSLTNTFSNIFLQIRVKEGFALSLMLMYCRKFGVTQLSPNCTSFPMATHSPTPGGLCDAPLGAWALTPRARNEF